MKEIEVWKSLDFLGYPNYEVSTLGNVKSLNYLRTGKERLLKPIKNSKGYVFVGLCKDGKRKLFRVHKLVCLTFLENPKNYNCINHKDENKENNQVNNLEWCTYEYNINYGTRNERVSEANKGKKRTEETKQKMRKPKSEEHKQKMRKPKSEEHKQKMRKPMKARKARKGENHPMFGKHHSEETRKKISNSLKAKLHSEKIKKKTSRIKRYKSSKPILQFTLDNIFIREWDNMTSINIELNIHIGQICECCKGKRKTAGGFIWKYKI